MAISLKKGQKVDLTKGNPGLSKLLIGLGWDTNKYDGGSDFVYIIRRGIFRPFVPAVGNARVRRGLEGVGRSFGFS